MPILFLFLYFSNRESLDWKVPKERLVLLVLKGHLESPVLKASGASLAQLYVFFCPHIYKIIHKKTLESIVYLLVFM